MSALFAPSRRTPEFSTISNTADNIERCIQRDGHKTWGFVIYRCTYDSDEEWNEFMERLRYHIRRTLEFYNGLDLMDSLDLTVIEDREELDDVEASVVREHFRTWAETAPQREQGQPQARIRPNEREEWESQRYLYCIQVDAEVLNSVVHWAEAPPSTDFRSEGFVKIVSRYWEPLGARDRDPPQEPIEGCTEDDVGWMIVDYTKVVTLYDRLRDRNDWYGEYRRPPNVADGSCLPRSY
jgi:hypothetical protein